MKEETQGARGSFLFNWLSVIGLLACIGGVLLFAFVSTPAGIAVIAVGVTTAAFSAFR
ncbi:MAG TPA: hypothetical protein VIK22_12170 [Candidatus Anoxymicrobiaceae bacterium]|jgi:hypothetical protein